LFPFRVQASQVPANLSIEASYTVEAAKTEGDKPTLPTFKMVANTGIPFKQPHLPHPVILDIGGGGVIFAKATTPVIMDHKTDQRVGHTTSQNVDRKSFNITAEGVVSSSSQYAKEFVTDSKSGYPFQVSFGADVKEGEIIEAGETVKVNGKTYDGPLIVATKAQINELTVTVLGADKNTSVRLAASRSQTVSKDSMDFATWLQAMALDINTLTADQKTKLEAQFTKINATRPSDNEPADASYNDVDDDIDTGDVGRKGGKRKTKTQLQAAAIAKEELRIDTIRATAEQYVGTFKDDVKIKADGKEYSLAELKAHAIADEMEPHTFELHLMRAERNTKLAGINGKGPAIHVAKQLRDLTNEVISAAACRTLGVPQKKTHEVTGEEYGLEAWFKPEVLEASHHKSIRRVSLHQLMDLSIIAATGMPYSGNRKSDDFIEATRNAMFQIRANATGGSGTSTLSVTNIFDDVAHKILLAAYNGVNTTWQEWVGVKSVDDFKTHNLYRLVMTGAYEEVGPDGQLAHGGFSDDKFTISTDTYGKMVGLTRKDLINDDLGALKTLMTALGIEGAKTLEEVAYVYLLTNLATRSSPSGREEHRCRVPASVTRHPRL
jgi:hypothetical protein